MRAYRKFKQQSLAIAVVFIVISLVGVQLFSPLVVLLIVAPLFLVALSWRLYRALDQQLGEQQFNEYRQQEALSAIYNTLDIQHPLPRMRHTAASPDFLHLMASEIFRLRPQTIVEVGSGTSTLIAAYCLRKIGAGKIVSLDHLQKYADITRQTIDSHGLGEFAEVIHAPLKPYSIDGREFQWYDDAGLRDIEQIDVLIVDGPPQEVSSDARYPAIPLLQSRLHADSIVLLDDGAREDETRIVKQWKQNHGFDYAEVNTEKGAFVCSPSD